MKELMKVFSNVLAMWREWRMAGLLKGSIQRNVLVVAQSVGCRKDGLILRRNA